MADARERPAAMSCQARFHERWPELRDPHVRALAWLLDAPDLMAVDAPCWDGRIATLGPVADEVAAWLRALEQDPRLNRQLHDHMARQPSARLGRYAEKLLGFYLQQRRQLVAANLQVRNNGATSETLGEFDFLVRRPHIDSGTGLEHWEFATKFYLLEQDPSQLDQSGELPPDAFVGPNLADSLGRKMRKIMQQQLMLSRHPAAAGVLSEPVVSAQALVKGWLFYREPLSSLPAAIGIAADHCRGFWCDAAALRQRYAEQSGPLHFLLLPRLEWLAPARVDIGRTLGMDAVQAELAARLSAEPAPLMLAVCRGPGAGEGSDAFEIERGFIVPGDWEQRAAEQVRHAVIRI
ncbi:MULTISPECIES: DUF1853 family protein [unclassified Herbaspirillum]|uniref:DUF1853 family protein n=1 Tax=unclassified Herbaspirillum TaxID=2624150 RepID=UPI00115325BD|nr:MULTISPECIES: DUF1853 family protein [unclassified Herbaspirillum]MBB5393061.1 hypothetical protein [Herbaspirillum sp. SJZ102]TQK04296.1 hypothetical protein FB599_2847 [Herbaspirillum sp. SJZ130]TQK09919.1 hypothetical protein FB598_2915 [Herbaspirillum sp. SJZ106]